MPPPASTPAVDDIIDELDALVRDACDCDVCVNDAHRALYQSAAVLMKAFGPAIGHDMASDLIESVLSRFTPESH